MVPWLVLNTINSLQAATSPATTPTGPSKIASKQTRSTILVLGDSLSAEYGLPRGSGWVHQLQSKLAQTTDYRHWQVINASISGETTSGGLSRLPALLQQHQPAVVIIELGANDGLRGLSLEATEENLRTLTKQSQQQGARVVMVGMQLPPNFGKTYVENFSAMFKRIATQQKTALVPFLLTGFATDMKFFQPDRIHPNESAQPIMLNNVWTALAPLLTQNK